MRQVFAPIYALAAAAMLASGPSFADERGRNGDYQRGNHQAQTQEDRRDDRYDDRRMDRRDDRHMGRHDGRHFDPRDGRWNQRHYVYNARGPHFYRGGYIPREYRMRAYEVDYHEHRLSRPPQGQRWVQVGADYVLIAIATGVIANIILNQ